MRAVSGARALGADAIASRLPQSVRACLKNALRAQVEVHVAAATYAYHVTLLARAASQGDARSGRLLRACAEALGVTRQNLQPYVLVGVRWPPDELERLLQRRDIRNRPLSSSHILLLARLPRFAREYWTERALEAGLSVRELRAAMKAEERPVDRGRARRTQSANDHADGSGTACGE